MLIQTTIALIVAFNTPTSRTVDINCWGVVDTAFYADGREVDVFTPWPYAYFDGDPPPLGTDFAACLAGAQLVCSPNGVHSVKFSINPTTGAQECDITCNTPNGTS